VAQPDLILLNESLPDMDGEAVVYRLLNDPLTSDVPVVVMSSNGHGEKLKQRYANVVRSIQKPVSAESLLPVVSTQLAQAKAPLPPPASSFSAMRRSGFRRAHGIFLAAQRAADGLWG